MKAGLTSHGIGGSRSSNGNNGGNKIVVPIPVHVNRFAIRSQHQHMEKMGLSGPKPELRKDLSVESSCFERFKLNSLGGSQSLTQLQPQLTSPSIPSKQKSFQ